MRSIKGGEEIGKRKNAQRIEISIRKQNQNGVLILLRNGKLIYIFIYLSIYAT